MVLADGRHTVGRRTGHKSLVITLPKKVRFRALSAREELRYHFLFGNYRPFNFRFPLLLYCDWHFGI